MFLKCFKVPEAAVFIDKSVLIVLRSFFSSSNTTLRDEFHVDLDALTWVLHLLVGFGLAFWIGQFDGHLAMLAQEAVQTGDRADIAPLLRFNPKDH